MAQRLASFDFLGVSIRLDASWILLALLIAWSLAAGTFSLLHGGLPQFSSWLMAGAAVVGVAASIILHELGHTLIARAFGLPIKSITLFMFGGVAEMEGEPKAPTVELLIALAGPVVSVILGFSFFAFAGLFPHASPNEYYDVLNYLGTLNLTLAAFNLAPAFPLDGGRVLRAVIWLKTGDALKATNIAARAGELVAILMAVIGAIAVLGADLAIGLWSILIGWFIFAMARAYRAQARARYLLSGARVGDLMTTQLVTASAETSIEDFVKETLARHPHHLIPLLSDNQIVGVAGFKEVRLTPRETWRDVRLTQIMTRIDQVLHADQGEPVEVALERMQRAKVSRLIVMDGTHLVGILTLKDLATHLRFRAEFGSPRSTGLTA